MRKDKVESIKYELRYKTKGYSWRVFDTYKSKDDPELIHNHNVYSKSKIIVGVEVIEIKTSRTNIKLK